MYYGVKYSVFLKGDYDDTEQGMPEVFQALDVSEIEYTVTLAALIIALPMV